MLTFNPKLALLVLLPFPLFLLISKVFGKGIHHWSLLTMEGLAEASNQLQWWIARPSNRATRMNSGYGISTQSVSLGLSVAIATSTSCATTSTRTFSVCPSPSISAGARVT